MNHHPALLGIGAALAGEGARELEIAQRQALHEAQLAAQEARRRGALPISSMIACAIDAYLAAMRRDWRPEAIEIGEGDYVVIEAGGRHARVEVGSDEGVPSLTVTGLDCSVDVSDMVGPAVLYLEQ